MQVVISLLLFIKTFISYSYILPKTFIRTDRQFNFRAQSLVSSTAPQVGLVRNDLLSGAKFAFIGGKGGVGKTTSSSAIALALSDRGHRTLVVSTDPAHSLGDALDINLSSGGVVPVTSENNLWALEIDIEKALLEFKNSLENLDTDSIARTLGIPREIVDSFGIQDIADIFVNPPPGIDEIVALSKIFQYTEGTGSKNTAKFDRVVVDTAPTGHTLRLLQLPQFLNTLTGKLLKLRTKIYSAVETFQSFFGSNANSASPSSKISSILDKLDSLQSSIATVQRVLKDPKQTQFVIVTIPTILAVAESKRLLASLQSEGIAVSNIICNQVLSESSDIQYIKTRSAGQRKCIDSMHQHIQARHSTISADKPGVPNSLAPPPEIEITEVPFVDTEVTGVFGLRFFHNLAHPVQPRSATNPMSSRKLTIFGGKGGVGKTTSAASWAVRLCDSGYRTLLVSSDPAHSLGDALQQPLSGVPQSVDLHAPSGDAGQLWAMEIDPAAALQEFKNLVRNSTSDGANGVSPGDRGGGGIMGSLGLPDLGSEMAEMLFGIQEPPPGTDEIVALAKVIEYLDNGYTVNGQVVKFDRIVLDTAPTGHTLRMLQLPQFLQQIIAKLKVIRSKTKSMGGIMGMFGSKSGSPGGGETSEESDTLERFQTRMRRLEALLHSPKECEFTAVTIPTELATSETKRLLDALQQANILVRRLIINQVLPADASADKDVDSRDSDVSVSSYMNKLRSGQQSCLAELRSMAASANASLIEVPYFDTEVRTVYGLRLVSNALFQARN